MCDLCSLLPVPTNLHPDPIREVPCPVYLPIPSFALRSAITLSRVYVVFSLTRAVLFLPCIVQCHLFRSSSADSSHSLRPVFPVYSLPITATSPFTGRMCNGHELAIHLWVFSALLTLGLGVKQEKLDFFFFDLCLSVHPVNSLLAFTSSRSAHLDRTPPPPKPTAFSVCRIHRLMKGD